jgi:hypothetical protein
MYTPYGCLIYIPKNVRRSAISGRHQLVFTNPAFPKKRVPVGFCCGGFSSTAGYVPGNEAQLALSDCATTEADQFLVARPVFIRALSESPEGLSPASLSASAWGVNSNFSPPEIALKPARHRADSRSLRWSRLP